MNMLSVQGYRQFVVTTYCSIVLARITPATKVRSRPIHNEGAVWPVIGSMRPANIVSELNYEPVPRNTLWLSYRPSPE